MFWDQIWVGILIKSQIQDQDFSDSCSTGNTFLLNLLNLFLWQVVSDPTGPMAPFYLAGFCASTVAAISIMGGTFAVLPAYEAGTSNVLLRNEFRSFWHKTIVRNRIDFLLFSCRSVWAQIRSGHSRSLSPGRNSLDHDRADSFAQPPKNVWKCGHPR